MIELSDFISLIYIVIGVLVIRQIFKKNLLLRCISCKTFGTLKSINATEVETDNFFSGDNLIDSEQVPKKGFWNDEFYKCRKCGQVMNINDY